jgi:spermidine synthase
MHLKSPYFVVMVAAMRFASERPQSVLVVGMGGGALPLYLRNRYPSVVVDAVEYDPAVVRVARDYFGVMEDKRLHVIQGDGRDAVRNADRRYDAIILDAFGAEDYPPHLVTAEFFEEVRAKLAPGGVVIANLLGRSHNARYVDMLGTFLTVFPAVGTVRVPERDQTVVVARRDAVDGDPWELRGGMDVRPLTLGQLGHVIVLRD